ncbi:trimeric LpxA-like protein [Phakopsora pachyrhizi]|nr:trimeric LpxA-like protein [Phakopsora pachyrhizi]
MSKIENIFTFHPSSVVAQDSNLIGEVTIGPNCVVHPTCTIVALGPIIFGSGCIVEEQSLICNRRKVPMRIGDHNLFSVGCRVEAISVGSYNIFESKSMVSHEVQIGDNCMIGAGCTLVSEPGPKTFKTLDQLSRRSKLSARMIRTGSEDDVQQDGKNEDGSKGNDDPEGVEEDEEKIILEFYKTSGSDILVLKDNSVIYGDRSEVRTWSTEGQVQSRALHSKHLQYLHETLPKFQKTRQLHLNPQPKNRLREKSSSSEIKK